MSEATLGLLSNIPPITPKGIDTLFINNLFGLFHFSKVTSIGSFKFLTLLIAAHMLINFFRSIINLSIRFFLSFCLVANFISLLFCFNIIFLFFFIKFIYLSNTLFFNLELILFFEAISALLPNKYIKLLIILYFYHIIFMNNFRFCYITK